LGCEPELVVKALQVDVEAASASEAASAAGDSTSGLLSAFLSGQGRALSLCLIPKMELAGTRSFVIDFATPLTARLAAAWLSLVLLFATSCLLLNSSHALPTLLVLFFVRTHNCKYIISSLICCLAVRRVQRFACGRLGLQFGHRLLYRHTGETE
jgi:hypothetical protein